MTPFTADAHPEGEARVARDLEHVVAAVRSEGQADGLLAVVLLGGYARGEGTTIAGPDGVRRGFNDYDLLLVFDRDPSRPERFGRLGTGLARELEIDFVDLGLVSRAGLAAARPTLFWYELGEAHGFLWTAPGASVSLPRFRREDIDPEEGTRLLVNRGLALLWAALRLWPDGVPGSSSPASGEHLRFAVIAAHKAVLAAGDAALLRAGAYSIRQEEREEALRAGAGLTSWAPRGFLDDYAAAAAFRRRPAFPDPEGAGRLWARARQHHEAGLRAAEESRLGSAIEDWTKHARILHLWARRNLLRPRVAARTMRRVWRGGSLLRPEDRRLLDLAALLHGPPSGGGAPAWPPGWRTEAETLIREWHP